MSIAYLLKNLLLRCSAANDAFACLVAVDAELLEKVNSQVSANGYYGTFVTVPVVDGEFIVERPVETLSKGRLNTVLQLRVIWGIHADQLTANRTLS